jgi:FlaA1/EpsC-like NDP-sugar epimerase
MGEPIRIATLAERMIRLAGLQVRSDRNPNGDISIELTGLRPGEKLHEELLTNSRPEGTQHPRIFLDKNAGDLPNVPSFWIKRFERAIDAGDREDVIAILQQLVDEFSDPAPSELEGQRLQVPAPSDAG